MKKEDLLELDTLKNLIDKDTGLLFVFGSSFISKLIQAKTRKFKREVVPSHVAIIYKGKFLYESTVASESVGNKTIPSGVRRFLLSDFFISEADKESKYYFVPMNVSITELEKHVHLPYGKDIILDFLLKDGSDGESEGLICSQYANLVTKLLDMDCPSPANMFREAITKEN